VNGAQRRLERMQELEQELEQTKVELEYARERSEVEWSARQEAHDATKYWETRALAAEAALESLQQESK
jgi:hypothetical protein